MKQRHIKALSALIAGASLFACSPSEDSSYSPSGESYESSGPSGQRLAPPAPPGDDDYDDYAQGGSAAGQEWSDELEEPVEQIEVNPEVDSAEDNLITFAVDVDTASYALSRSAITNGYLPSPQNVRTEEFINYFDYRDEAPASEEEGPFAVSMELASSPFGGERKLLRVGVKGYEVARDERPAANLVFLLDVSGSMNSDQKLGLVKRSMSLMLDNLNGTDTVGIVTYAGADRVVLEPTEASDRDTILNAINNLSSGGGTNGAAGINSAYELAERHFVTGGINRVILCTDGDFNVGVTGERLYSLIEEKRERGVTISVFGFGMRGSFNDNQMEQIANRGNGNYAFIDTLAEAQRALVDRLTSAIFTIAKDVKLQLEVNPFLVKSHRLLGYENRAIADEDFRDDSVDAGEIGAGHTVTALIELQLFEDSERPSAERFEGRELDEAFYELEAPLSVLRIRSKGPDASAEDPAKEQRFELALNELITELSEASQAFRFGAAVAEFAEILRGSSHVESPDFEAIISLATGAVIDEDPTMLEFLELVAQAERLY
jgi:Ca-activated chloride channel family protein